MKKILYGIVMLSGVFVNAQTTIVDEKFETGNKPIEFEVIAKENVLLVKKGKSYGSIRGINKVESYALDNLKPKQLVDNVKFLNFSPSLIDDVFFATEFNGVGWAENTKVYSGDKLLATIDNKKPLYLFSKEYTYSVGNEKNKFVESLEKENIFLHKYAINTGKTDLIPLAKPAFLNVNKKDYFKLKQIRHKIFYHKQSFDITTKFINPDGKSFILHRAIFDLQGKNIKNLSYDINIEKPLIFSNNNGGEIESSFNNLSNSYYNVFDDQLSINNYYLDPKTNDLYIYGLYGKKEGKLENNEVAGYYVVKFDANGKKIWQKAQAMSDEDINENASKLRLNLDFEVINKTILFSIFEYTKEKYFFYNEIETTTNNIIKSNKINFDVDKMNVGELRDTEVLAFFKLKEYKNLKFDYKTLYFANESSKIRTYLSILNNSKNKISVNSLQSDKGIWLVESDNKSYYKITFFDRT